MVPDVVHVRADGEGEVHAAADGSGRCGDDADVVGADRRHAGVGTGAGGLDARLHLNKVAEELPLRAARQAALGDHRPQRPLELVPERAARARGGRERYEVEQPGEHAREEVGVQGGECGRVGGRHRSMCGWGGSESFYRDFRNGGLEF